MEYKIGLHIHTTLSDGKLTPEEVAKKYKAAGYDAIAITDHWKYYPEGELEGLRILSGCEYNIGGGDATEGVMHLVGVGMKEEIKFPIRPVSRQEIIDAIKNAGGMVALAHPAWSLNTLEDVKALHGIDMLEIYNSVSDAHQSMRPYSGYIVDILADNGIFFPLTATDDAHYYDGSDETKSYIVVDSKSLDTAAIFDAIRNCRFYATQGPRLSVKREGNLIKAECSECERICFFSNYVWASDRVFRGEGLTYAEHPIRDGEKWIRVEVRDSEGREAWSNIIQI